MSVYSTTQKLPRSLRSYLRENIDVATAIVFTKLYNDPSSNLKNQRKTKRSRKSLTDLSPEIHISNDASKSLPTMTSEEITNASNTTRTMRLKDTISKRWPRTRFSQDKEQMNMTIFMDNVYRVYKSDTNPIKLFEKASTYLTAIQSINIDDNSSDLIQKQLRESILRAIFGSNQIERAGLGLDETMYICERIFNGEEVEHIDERTPDYERKIWELYNGKSGKKLEGEGMKSYIRGRGEVISHAKAFQYMLDCVVSLDLPITESIVKSTHRILCENTPIVNWDGSHTNPRDYAGVYRDVHNVHVGAGTTMFTPPNKVPGAMKTMIAELNQDIEDARKHNKMDPFALASKYSMQFVQIHPFQDGNGRMCRMILNVILCRYAGIVVPIGEEETDRREYIGIKKRASSEAADHGEYAVFVLNKAETRLRTLKKKLMAKKDLNVTSK
ncbi:fido domain-containing protein [Xylariaceae sp. FL1272]|nr:fido domain-containing protein [Xylariaceae sp. FL1272]